MRFGVVASAAFNPHRGKDGRAIKPGEWFGYAEPTPEMTDDQMLLTMRQLAASHNARLKK
jgi:hypothetical protein